MNGIYFDGTQGVFVTANGKTVLLGPAGELNQEFDAGPNKKEPDFANFIPAVESPKADQLKCEMKEGHISAALCHAANISQGLAKPTPQTKIAKKLVKLKVNDDVKDTPACTATRWKKNGVKS